MFERDLEPLFGGAQPRLGPLAGGDVARGDHDALDVGVAFEVPTHAFEFLVLAPGGAHPQLERFVRIAGPAITSANASLALAKSSG